MSVWLIALAALTLLRLVLAFWLPLSPDETYYFLWSRNLQAGYFDHPPMVALWIRAGTALAGYTPLGIRLFGPLSAALGSLVLWQAAENFFPGRRAGLAAVILLNTTLMVGVGAIVMTPDTPLFFFWTLAVAALGRLLITGNQRWWLAVGIAAGLALLSKYTGFLLLAGVGIWLLASVEGRARLRSPWPWIGLLLALAIFLPNVVWNAAHHWVSYLKQGGRISGFDAARAGQFLAELFTSQFGLATPIIFILGVCGVWRLRRLGTPGASLLFWVTIIPGLVFLEHVLTDRVQANWPAVLYPSACLAAAGLPPMVLRRWLAPAAGLGVVFTIIVYLQALTAPFPLPARMDPTALQFSGWDGLASQVAAQAETLHAAFITSDEYTPAGEFALLAPLSIPIVESDTRWHYFGFPHAQAGQMGIMVTRRHDTPCTEQLGSAVRTRNGQVISQFKLCAYTSPPGSVILPRP